MIFLYLFIFVTFLGVFWAQVQRARNILRTIYSIISENRKAFDSKILDSIGRDRLVIFDNLISNNAQLYIIYDDGNSIKIDPLNNNITQYLSKSKYKKLHAKLKKKMLIYSCIFSPSIYYKLEGPNQNVILWIFNY